MKVIVKYNRLAYYHNRRYRPGEVVDLGEDITKCPSWGAEVGTKAANDESETIRRAMANERAPRAFKLHDQAKAQREAVKATFKG